VLRNVVFGEAVARKQPEGEDVALELLIDLLRKRIRRDWGVGGPYGKVRCCLAS
jgi:hypothetical protein